MKLERSRSADFSERKQGVLQTLILVLICAAGVGSFFCFDIPVALGVDILDDISIDRFEYGAFYSVYFLPNVLMVFYGAKILNAIGIRWCLIIYTAFVLFGQILISVGYRGKSYFTLLIGRFAFGFGGETLAVIQNAAVSRWFSGERLNQAYSVVLTMSRMGSILCFAFVPSITEEYGAEASLWIGNYVCIGSFIASALYYIIDYHINPQESIQEINFSDNIDMETLRRLSPTYWWAISVGMSFYMSVFCFVPFSVSFGGLLNYSRFNRIYLQEEKNLSLFESGFETMIIFLVPLIFGPFLKNFVNRSGKRGFLLSFALIQLLPVYLVLAMTEVNAVYGVITMGVSHLIISTTLFPSVSLLVDPNELGVALGLFQAILDLGLYLCPIGAGLIIEYSGYDDVMFLFAATTALGTLLSIALNLTQDGPMLNSAPADRSSTSTTECF